MVDKSRLQIVGWLFGGMTCAVILVAALLVGDAVASNTDSAVTLSTAAGSVW